MAENNPSSLNNSLGSVLGDMQEVTLGFGNMEDAMARFNEDATAAAAARNSALLAETQKYYELRNKIAEQANHKEAQQAYQEVVRQYGKNSTEAVKAREQLAQLEGQIEQKAIRTLQIMKDNALRTGTISEKLELRKRSVQSLQEREKALKKQRDLEIAQAQLAGEDTAAIEERYREAKAANDAEYAEQSRDLRKLEQAEITQHYKRLSDSLDEFQEHPSLKSGAKLMLNLQLSGVEDLKKITQNLKDQAKAENQKKDELYEELEALRASGASEDEIKAKEDEVREQAAIANQATMAQAMAQAVTAFKEATSKQFKEAENIMNNYKGVIDSRLQGSDSNFSKMLDLTTSLLSASPFAQSKKVIENMKTLADQGIAYNVEQRAFLGTIANKIAATFDAFDSNLTRLIKLQQADSTAARLGMEAALTKFLNSRFEDSSYLGSSTAAGVSDQVAGKLIDASATMTHKAAAEFEFTVQKWLGSLSSLGMDSGTLTTIAEGLNYLATGDVQGLASNTQLQTLMAMSAANAGLEYSELLLRGLDSSSTNKLLQSMVTYLKDIAENSDNQVVRAAYGDVFNLSMSDMKAISNLTAGDIKSIGGTSLSYGGMNLELAGQIRNLVNRTTISEMMDNLYQNATFGVAVDAVTNPAVYAMYKMLDFMHEQELNINIPFVSAAGFGLDVNSTVEDLLNLGIGLSQAMSLAGNMLQSLGSGGGLILNAWGGTEYTKRGSGTAFSTGGVQGVTSSSTYISTSSTTDMENSTLNSATDDAEKKSEITNKNQNPGHTIDDFYKVTVEGSEGTGFQRVQDILLREVYKDTSSDFLHTRDSRLLFKGDSYDSALRVYDPYMGIVFSTNGVIDAQKRVKVFDTSLQNYAVGTGTGTLRVGLVGDSVIAVKPFDTANGLLVNIKNTTALHPTTQKVNGTVDLSSTTVSQLAEQLGKKLLGEGVTTKTNQKKTPRTISDLYALFAQTEEGSSAEKAHVRIQNEDGTRLQVDTEMDGTSWSFHSGMNVEDQNKLVW